MALWVSIKRCWNRFYEIVAKPTAATGNFRVWIHCLQWTELVEIHTVGPCYPCYLLDEEVQSPELLGMRKRSLTPSRRSQMPAPALLLKCCETMNYCLFLYNTNFLHCQMKLGVEAAWRFLSISRTIGCCYSQPSATSKTRGLPTFWLCFKGTALLI